MKLKTSSVFASFEHQSGDMKSYQHSASSKTRVAMREKQKGWHPSVQSARSLPFGTVLPRSWELKNEANRGRTPPLLGQAKIGSVTDLEFRSPTHHEPDSGGIFAIIIMAGFVRIFKISVSRGP
jgi:hypothetical protein